ncbi:membrane anchor subunit of succinate dehydrogenase [Suhomyces tanzawaensis NRRL Y-17324]|uniref:Succinate dehydrogenase [ubiquinone] cytochrome b small subunit n=1 Tax=Suhomyces tanzawaensis NRRL Y-17324 TaxID=984487 RepID=A0A1E4SM04_9ASCO|nr:membrane anchor subunit of succinate dehydrogenase [Suhomyces tanzawaensis NRRL Y-17324]ODV80556.1 membrane anchor subunit of succinate dehydrogenase [Suhomyces tanzawaensis NRRL Y-17324]
MLGLHCRTRAFTARPSMFTRPLSLKPNFAKYKLIPQPAGNIVGTVNDAYQPPMADHYEGGYHWSYERAISVALVPLVMTPFVAGVDYPLIDAVCSVALLFHCHVGLKACIIDYIPQRVYGVWHKIASRLLTFGTFVGMYGAYVLETDNNGLFDLLQHMWGA